MMTELFRDLPEYVCSEGKDYKINTQFNVWLELSECFSDNSLSDDDKLICLLMKGYANEVPSNVNDAIDGLLYFMSRNKKSDNISHEPLISYVQDEGLIYAAFLQQYNIDLFETDLHWWKFLYLLEALDENTGFMKVVSYRSINLGNIKNPERKRFYREMKRKYCIEKCVDEKDIADALDCI